MVTLSKIYTRTGDAGSTRLVDNSVARKTDLRVQAYGTVDEANSQIGVVLSLDGIPRPVRQKLELIQNELFDVGADLSTPLAIDPPWPPLRIEQPSIDQLEAWCDELNEALPTLRSFVLPGGTPASAHLHVARTLVRRAERIAWEAVEVYGDQPAPWRAGPGAAEGSDTDSAAAEESPADAEQPQAGGVHVLAVTYLNRLSDLLFLMARTTNLEHGEVLWVPGGERNPQAPRRHASRG